METILVVDDEPTVLSFCERILQMGGYRVLRAGGAEAALRVSSNAAHPIDLALLDVMMPGLNGIELAGRLRAVQPELPIVLMSGFGPQEIGRVVGEHKYRIIWKPFQRDSLLRMIENALGQSADTTV